MDDIEIKLLEERASNAHVALDMMLYDGWILKFSEGYSHRANSVGLLYPSTIDPEEKIDYCEKRYAEQNLPCTFKLTDRDTEMYERLVKRGYREASPSDLMILALQDLPTPEGTFRFSDRPSEEWLRAYFTFKGYSDPGRQNTIRRMLAKVRVETCFAAVLRDGAIAACASTATERGYALLQNVVTDPCLRWQGIGRTVCLAMLSKAKQNGAEWAYLQVDTINTPARRMYDSMGFQILYSYRYMEKHLRG